MNSFDLFSMAVRNLLKRKTRTSLTILGVVIGTSAIVIMMSLGLAMDKTFKEQLASLGDLTTIRVYNYGGNQMYSSDSGSQRNKPLILDKNMIKSFEKLSGVIVATPILEHYTTIGSTKYMAQIQVMGIDPAAMAPLGYAAASGRLLEPTDKMDVVFGSELMQQFYNPKKSQWPDPSKAVTFDPLKTKFKASSDWRYYMQLTGQDYGDETTTPLKTVDMKVVGVLAEKGYPENSAIIMNIDALVKFKADEEKAQQAVNSEYGYNQGVRNKKDTGYNLALVKCTDLAAVKEVKLLIEKMGFQAEIPSQSLDSMENISNSLQSLLGAIGAVSFFVAALGITNTMVTAIYERTREIGIMKVVGASLGDIRKLFLVESSLIGLIGGIVGVLLSLLISYIINTSGATFFSSISEFAMQTTVSLINPELCGLAVLFATIMGLLAGYFPAQRAMNLSALSAIKTE